MPNLLIHESSPYLLQHAHNPVNWYPWCEAAFEKANKEDKPVLVSIGYATCHWCHVMERESFEDEQVADFMNAHFVSIKIDREEYPELDQIYMQAVQLLTGSGGWPLNCFLLPDKRPFIGGTYYPPHPGYNRPSWMHLLQHVHKVYHEKRTQVEEQAEKLMLMIARSGEQFIDQQAIQLPENRNFNWKDFADKFSDHFDNEWGGFGQAPKFPGMPSLMLCIELGYYLKDDIFSEHACMTMDKMIMGGIHDAAGGGFARYATDREWRIPHFEKMLYDNAQILEGLGALYQLTGKSHYKSCAEQIVLFLNREMKDDNGLYYSALDADSEGVEGKFYTWTYEELCQLTEGLDQSALFEYYNISKEGNWENNNILFSDQLPDDYAKSNQIEFNEWDNQLNQFHERLMQRRAQRQRPGLDHKVLLSWNALLAKALLLWKDIDNENPLFKNGGQLIELLLEKFMIDGSTLQRVSTDDKVKLSGNLDDYAYLISALIKAEQTTGQQKYIATALILCEKVNSDFVDSNDKMFYFSSLDTKGLPLRMKEIMDTSMPDAGAIMCKNLWQLGIITGDDLFKDHARSLFYQLSSSINKFPSAFSSWARVGLRVDFPFYEIDILGIKKESMLNDIKKEFLPNKLICNRVIHMFEKESLSDKEAPQVLICKENSCELPLDDVSNAIQRLKEII